MTSPQRTSLKDIRKEEIMKAALTVLSERGSANVTLDDIAKGAGFSKGGITYYYSSKEALIKDVFEYFFESVYQKSYEEIAKHKDPLNKFLSFAWIYEPDVYMTETMYPLLFDIMVLAAYNNDYRAAFRNMIISWIKIGGDVIEEGRETGLFQIDDSYEVAKLISAVAQGIATRWYLDRENHTTEWAVNSWKRTALALLNVQTDKIPKEQS
jgi:AcrR family transcriptional regulator